jgi:hypothetical protein
MEVQCAQSARQKDVAKPLVETNRQTPSEKDTHCPQVPNAARSVTYEGQHEKTSYKKGPALHRAFKHQKHARL